MSTSNVQYTIHTDEKSQKRNNGRTLTATSCHNRAYEQYRRSILDARRRRSPWHRRELTKKIARNGVGGGGGGGGGINKTYYGFAHVRVFAPRRQERNVKCAISDVSDRTMIILSNFSMRHLSPIQ